MSQIRWLDRPGCDDPKLVGGKAAGLARLAADFPVPPGFCVTAAAQLEAGVGAVPPPLAAAVATAYAELGERCGGEDPVVAVRSSAVGEDAATASFAGIYRSCLNVRGVAALLAAVGEVWASLDTPTAAAYRTRLGLAGEPEMAVVVMPLLDFTRLRTPFTPNRYRFH